MKDYIVILEVMTMGIEKHTTHLVRSESEHDAIKNALLNEAHNLLGDGAEWESDDYDNLSDFHGEWVYTVISVQEVSQEDIKILKKYL